MKKILSFFILLFIISCGNKTESKLEKSSKINTDTINLSEKRKEVSKIYFEEYKKDGILLNETVNLFNEDLNKIGELKIEDISKVKILEKSVELYNVEKSIDYCLKSNFLKIKYKDKDYIVFGREIYEINDNQKIDFQNEKSESFTILSITNFEMGASDDEGLTACDDFSYLIILNKKNNKYLTINAPKKLENHSNEKFANLLHDDGSEEKVYNVNIIKDSLILGIKISYQEGYGSYNLSASFKDNFKNSIVTNQRRFDEEAKYKELK